MDNLKYPAGAYDRADLQESDANKMVCSQEFPPGCADPQKGMPPELAPGAPIPGVEPRPLAQAPAEAVEAPAPVLTHNAAEQPEAGFPEIACSQEFRDGCVNPADDDGP